MTVIAFLALAASAWGTFDLATSMWGDLSLRRRTSAWIGDVAILSACASCAVCALYTLTILWITP